MDAWHLMRGDIDLGRLTLTEVDQPFFRCKFDPTPAFSLVAELFATELASLGRDDMEQWERDYQRIGDLALVLTPVSAGDPIDDFLLHVDGDEAWFRH